MTGRSSTTILAVGAMLLAVAIVETATAKSSKVPGIRGTITSVGGNFFMMALTGKTSDPATKVWCDANTKFIRAGGTVDASEIKEGLSVAVIGAIVGDYQLHASQVTIQGSATTKPAAKKK